MASGYIPKKICKINNLGQTSVEYILLIMVVVTLITSLMGMVKARYLGDTTKCATTSKNTLFCKILTVVNPAGFEGEGREQFRIYRLRR